jgi:UDP-2,3-diacylglucosamine pyrophosphatase LpxH
MTTLAFIGDPHLGNFARHAGVKMLGLNARGRMTLKCLRDALDTAHQHGATLAVILGDLFDNMRPESQLIAQVRALFREMNANGLKILLLKGNHDSASDEPGDTALYAVSERHARVIDQPKLVPFGDVTLCMVPFQSGSTTAWLPGVLEALKPPLGSILCLHAGVKDQETAPWLQDAPDAIELDVLSTLMDQYEISHTFCGNWHDHKVWQDRDVHQVGALCPTGYANLGKDLYGYVALYQLGEDVTYDVVRGPRFLKLTPTEHPKDLPITGDAYHVEWHVAPERYETSKAELETLIRSGHITAGSVLPDSTGVREGLREAAIAARAAVGLDEAISAYVAELKVPGHLRKESVEARVRAFMGV